MQKLFLGLLLLVVVMPIAANAADSDELWEVQTRVDMGITLPGLAMPAVTQTVCLGQGGAYKPEKFLQEKNCEMTDLKVAGNKTSWKVRCAGDNAMEAQGEVMRNEDTMSGKVYMSMNGMKTNQIISGKRIGTCQQQ